MQLAKRLQDEAHLRDYLALAERHSEHLLLKAYQRAAREDRGNIAEKFHAELVRLIQKEEQ